MDLKHKLREKFHDTFTYLNGNLETQWRITAHPSRVFDFFWEEIEARDKTIARIEKFSEEYANDLHDLKAKLSQQEEIIMAADDLISALRECTVTSKKNYEILKSKELKYNDLKSKESNT